MVATAASEAEVLVPLTDITLYHGSDEFSVNVKFASLIQS